MTDPTTAALARATPRRRERDVQAAILDALRAHGIVAFPMNRERAGRQRANHIGVKGLPDIGGWIPLGGVAYRRRDQGVIERGTLNFANQVAIPLYVEVKRPRARTQRQRAVYQQAFLQKARHDGCVAFQASSVGDVAMALGWT